jgi:CheY-like chemotaxis protein
VSKRKLLLADDSITIQKVVNLTFADEGIDVISVGDGNSAMDKLREDSPDLVLADVNMPGLNGYEICEKIKEMNSGTPVILLVGSFEPFDEEEAKRVGADDYLTKPFQSISQLVNKVNELLDPEISPEENEPAISQETFSFESETEILETGEPENVGLPDYDDVINDDEMIQTDQVGSVPLDEMAKFETPITPEFNNDAGFDQEENPDNLVEQSYSYTDSSPSTDVYEISEEIGVDEFESSLSDQESEETMPTTDFNVTQTYSPEEKEEFTFTKSNNGQDLIDTQEIELENRNKLGVISTEADQTAVNSHEISEFAENSATNSEIEEMASDSGSGGFGFESGETKKKINSFEIVSPLNKPFETELENENEAPYLAGQESDFSGFDEKNTVDEITDLPIPEAASVLELDEVNLLELPPLEISGEEISGTTPEEESEEIIKEEAVLAPESNETKETAELTGPPDEFEDNAPDISNEEENMTARFDRAEHVSPEPPKAFVNKIDSEISSQSEQIKETISTEMVEAITQRVIEKLSERAIKEIAWEVVPQMADLIIKRLAEEKMKD